MLLEYFMCYTMLFRKLAMKYLSKENVTNLYCLSQLKVADLLFSFLVASIPKCFKYIPRYF
ncbi:hypothetical protein JHK86_031003 [Glycine max]|nr:hypothetical protein JHK86_031003 [Glycine max]